MKTLPKFLIVAFLLLTSNKVLSCCHADDRDLVQFLLESKNYTVFKCKILSTSTDSTFQVTSKALVLEVFLGKVTANEVTLNTGNEYSSTQASHFPVGMTIIVFGGGKAAYFHCGGICDNRTQLVDGSKNSMNTEKIQKTRSITFKNADGSLAASGKLENGLPSGFWKFWDETGKLKLEYNYTNKDSKHYNNDGHLHRFQTHYKDSIVYVDFVDPVNGIVRMKEVDFPNDSGFVGVFYGYFPNGVLKSIEGTVYIKEAGGGSSIKGKTGRCMSFHENGRIRVVGEYRNDRRIGIWKWLEEDGTLTTEVDYRDGTGNQ
jgi:antitoxin component YwqK of YwqJK toxin-antitoxin module